MTTKDKDNEAFAFAAQKWLGVKEDGHAGILTMAAFLDRVGNGFAKPSDGNAKDSLPTLPASSEARLKGVDDRLVRTVRRAATLSSVPFMVVEGLRTKERQAELYAQGRTKPGNKVTWTMASKHIEGLAVDLAPVVNGKIDWNDLAKFDAIYRAMMKAAAEEGVTLRYGGDWDGDGKLREKGETDSPHFEVSR